CTCCTAYCGMLTTQEYAPAGGSCRTDQVCQNPPRSPFNERGGSKPCNSFPHPPKLTNHKTPLRASPYNWADLSKTTTPARCHPGIIRQRLCIPSPSGERARE